MDRIDTMRAFVAVVGEGSFTRAAERLDISPQLASKYVSELERRLGVRLLNRTTRRLNLTEAGQRCVQRVQQLLDDMDDLENQLGDLQEQARGLLRVSAPVSFATRHLAPLLCEFQRAHPGVGIDLQLNDRKVDIVEEGFDIALRVGHLKSSSLIARRLAPVRLVICAAPDYLARRGRPRTTAELGGHRHLRYTLGEGAASPALEDWLRGTGRAGELACNNGDVLVQAAVEGAGIAIQPTFIVGEAIARGELDVLLPDVELEPLALYAVYAHRQFLASKVRCFIDFAGGYFGDPPYWDQFTSRTDRKHMAE